MDTDVLRNYGIDYSKGVERCLNSEELYLRVLSLFPDDTAFARAKAAYECGDLDALFKSVHELKGSAANVSLTSLYDAASSLVAYLRAAEPNPDDLAPLFAALEAAYNMAREGVALALAK